LDQLKKPSGIAFFEGHAYITDEYNERVLKVKPGETRGEVVFGGRGRGGGLDQLHSPSGIAFFEGHAYITDTLNLRVLKVKPGETRGEVFFSGDGYSGITFFEGHAYIADSWRILKVKPGGTRSEVFFRSEIHGGLDQLFDASGFTFFEGFMYVTDRDSLDSFIFEIHPGETHGAVVFRGREKGGGLDQLKKPSGIAFFEGHAYITDEYNERVLKVKPGETRGEVFFVPQGRGTVRGLCFHADTAFVLTQHFLAKVARVAQQTDQYSRPLTLASTLSRCFSAAMLSEQDAMAAATFLLTGPECTIPLPAETLKKGHWGRLPSFTVGSTHTIVTFEAKPEEVRLPQATGSRKMTFATLLLAVVLPSSLAHAAGSRPGHALFLVYVSALGVWAYTHGFLELPFLGVATTSSVGYVQMASTFLLLLALPWAAAAVHLLLSFDHVIETSFTTKGILEVSCATGTAWELHLCTAVSMTFSLSLWAIFLTAQVDSVSRRPLDLIPSFMKDYIPPAVRELDEQHSPWMKRMQVFVGWAYSSMYDQYADLTTNLIMLTCGFEYARWSLLALLVSLLLQNIGGAVHILLYNSSEHRWLYALMCLIMAPPWELVDPSTLKSSGMYMTAMRVVFEDLAQMISQVAFTLLVYRNKFVIFNLATSFCFAGLSAKTVVKYYMDSSQQIMPTEPPSKQTEIEFPPLLSGPIQDVEGGKKSPRAA